MLLLPGLVLSSCMVLVHLMEPPALPEISRGKGSTDELVVLLESANLRLPPSAYSIEYTIVKSRDGTRTAAKFVTTADDLDRLLGSFDRRIDDLEPGLNPWGVGSGAGAIGSSPETFRWDLDDLDDLDDIAGEMVDQPVPGYRYLAILVGGTTGTNPVVYLEVAAL